MPNKGSIQRACEQCGATFYTYPSRVKRGRGRFCSKPCFDLAQTTLVTVTCRGCGASFTSGRPSQSPRYCSKACLRRLRIARVAARFASKVDSSSPDGCWPWAGSINPETGYGQFNRAGIPEPAHRSAWVVATGAPIPRKGEVCHTCDNPPCVRNDDIGTYTVDGVAYPRRGHLFLATHAVNVRDMELKGRLPNRRVPHRRNR